MCGIAGIIHYHHSDPVSSELLHTMLKYLIHRGPDDAGVYIAPDKRVGLGVRRLSVIDLRNGAQPMCNEEGDVWCVHNGEIYNYRELRARLIKEGHLFRTRCDTEVLLHAYEQWGIEMLHKLRGMFAFGLWDARRNRLLLARDRLGKKPLYYTQRAGRFLFASEVKALLADHSLPRAVDPGALWRLFTLGYVQGSQTLFAGVKRIDPACYLLAERGMVQIERYWTLPNEAEAAALPVDVQQAVGCLRELLTEAVWLRLQADVPIGVMLSGGVDSGTVAALAQAHERRPLHTFSIGFDLPDYDETEHAQIMARHIGSQHHEFDFSFQDFARYPESVWHVEQPECFGTLLPLFRLYEECHELGFKVMLTGEGADELFAGYHWFRSEQCSRLLSPVPLSLRRWLAASAPGISQLFNPVTRRTLTAPPADPVARYLHWHVISSPWQRESLFEGRPPADEEVEARWQARYGPLLQTGSALSHALYLEHCTRLPDYINHELDAMSMAHSVEARAPFLDHILWEEVTPWPDAWKLPWWQAEKYVLRRAVTDLLPAEILRRRKQGLVAPLSLWWRNHPLPDFAEDALAADALRQTGYFSPAFVTLLREEHQAGIGDHSQLLMGVLSVQLWHQQFLAA